MKVYKYRDFRRGDAMARIVRHGLIWCAKPDTLNDPTEFTWNCDFSETPSTISLVAELLEDERGRPRDTAFQMAFGLVAAGKLRELGETVIDDTIRQCRAEIGVACFGCSPENPILWSRYADNGSGVCVEIDVPDAILGNHLHPVIYGDDRRIHVDDFLRARKLRKYAALHWATLLSKPEKWRPEDELRFVSKRQAVEVRIDDSSVSRVILGPRILSRTAREVRDLCRSSSVPCSAAV